MKKQLIFIDDSGDPGFKDVSSSNFIMAAVLFTDLEVAELVSERIADYRKSFGWRDEYEFKFAKIRKDIIVQFLKMISNYDFQIYAVYIKKSSFKRAAWLIDKEKLYNWAIKELLSSMPLGEAKIEIDGRSSKQNMRRTAAYLRREIKCRGKKIEIKFEDSVHDNLIQLADLIAGSINRSMNLDKTDSKTYIGIIKNKIVQIKKID